MRMNINKNVSLLLGLVVAATSFAQSEQSVPQGVEQVDIKGEPTVISLKSEAEQLELKMYTIFNALNSSDELDVACSHVTPTGSKLPVWECSAAYMREAGNTNVQNVQQGLAAPQTQVALSKHNRAKEKQLNDELKALAYQHADLATAMLALNAKRQQMAALEEGSGKRRSDSSSGRTRRN